METPEKKAASVPGTGAAKNEPNANPATEAAQQRSPASDPSEQPESAPETRPAWVDEILESNKLFIEAVNNFVEAASKTVSGIVDEVRKASGDPVSEQPAELPKVKGKAKYVVGHGKKFQDKDREGIYFEAGEDITHIGKDRIARLLAQGIVEEASKSEDEDND